MTAEVELGNPPQGWRELLAEMERDVDAMASLLREAEVRHPGASRTGDMGHTVRTAQSVLGACQSITGRLERAMLVGRKPRGWKLTPADWSEILSQYRLGIQENRQRIEQWWRESAKL